METERYDMNYATKELTKSLQSLTREHQKQGADLVVEIPESIQANEFKFSMEIQSVLQKRSDYAAKSKSVRVGSY